MAVIAMAASNRLMSHLSRSVGVLLAATCKGSKQAALVYHLGGPSEQPIRHGQAERLRGLEVNNQKPRVPDAVQRPRVRASRGPRINSTKWSAAPLIYRDRHRLGRSRVCSAPLRFARAALRPG